MSIGARIKARRDELKLTQQGFAERVNAARGLGDDDKRTHQGDVSSWETGRSEPSTGTIVALAEALGKSVAWLLTGVEDVATKPATRKRRAA